MANVIDEVTEPLEEPRAMSVHNPRKIKRNAGTKTFQTVEETKRYKVVFDKRIFDPDIFHPYPYEYTRVELDDVDMENTDI